MVAMILYFLFSFLLSFNVFKIVGHQKKNDLILSCLGLLLIQSLVDIQLLLITLTSTYLLLNRQTKKEAYIIMASLLAVICLLIKSYGGIICFVIILSNGAIDLYQDKRLKTFLRNLFYYFAFILLVWLVLYQNVNGHQ